LPAPRPQLPAVPKRSAAAAVKEEAAVPKRSAAAAVKEEGQQPEGVVKVKTEK